MTSIFTQFVIGVLLNRNSLVEANFCYDPTNTQDQSTRTAAGETITSAGSNFGVVICTSSANCGISVATAMGVCISASTSTVNVIYVGVSANSSSSINSFTNAIQSCYVGTGSAATSTSCQSSIISPAVSTGACFVKNNFFSNLFPVFLRGGSLVK